MRYAQIKDGVVQNLIILNDAALESLFSQGFDALVNVTGTQVGIGWTYEAPDTFNPPAEE